MARGLTVNQEAVGSNPTPGAIASNRNSQQT